MLENCQKNPTILQFLEGPMFLNPLIYWPIVDIETNSLIGWEVLRRIGSKVRSFV